MNEIEELLKIFEKMLEEDKIRIIKSDGTTDYEEILEEDYKVKVKVKK